MSKENCLEKFFDSVETERKDLIDENAEFFDRPDPNRLNRPRRKFFSLVAEVVQDIKHTLSRTDDHSL